MCVFVLDSAVEQDFGKNALQESDPTEPEREQSKESKKKITRKREMSSSEAPPCCLRLLWLFKVLLAGEKEKAGVRLSTLQDYMSDDVAICSFFLLI